MEIRKGSEKEKRIGSEREKKIGGGSGWNGGLRNGRVSALV